MEIPSHKELVDYINRHLDDEDEKPSSFGRRVLGDSGALSRLYDGTDPRLSTAKKIVDAINEDKNNDSST